MKQYINITLEDFLNEGVNDNFIYSWISKEKIENIISNDIMFGNFEHIIKGKKYYGNSFSRNKYLELDVYHVRITVNKKLLTNNYKILPLDGEIIHRKIDITDKWKYTRNKDRNPKKINFFNDMPIKKDFHIHRFDEEFVIGDIFNISKYITEIVIYPKKRKWYSEEIDNDLLEKLKEYCNKHKINYIIK